jgi:hypothetical protein
MRWVCNNTIDFDQPQFRTIWQTQLKGHYSEGPFSDFGLNSFVGSQEVKDRRPS